MGKEICSNVHPYRYTKGWIQAIPRSQMPTSEMQAEFEHNWTTCTLPSQVKEDGVVSVLIRSQTKSDVYAVCDGLALKSNKYGN